MNDFWYLSIRDKSIPVCQLQATPQFFAFFSNCTVHFTNNHHPRGCLGGVNLIRTCPPSYTNSTIRMRCETGQLALVMSSRSTTLKYHNIYCALCHNESLSDITCRSNEGMSLSNYYCSVQPLFSIFPVFGDAH